MRVLQALTLTVAAMLLAACSGHNATDLGKTDPTTGNGAGTPAAATFHPLFAVAQGVLPYPTDLYFNGSTDGTLRLPVIAPLTPNAAAINQLDGFSTTAPITVRFSTPIDATTLNPTDVIVIRLTLDNETKAPLLPPAAGAQLPTLLTYGVDYRTYVVGQGPPGSLMFAQDTGGSLLAIEPLHPLDASSGATNIGYLVLLTNGIMDVNGNVAGPDTDYATVRNGALADLAAGKTTPTCASVTDATLNLICQLTFGHLAIAHQGGLDPSTVVLSFSFSTQSTTDTLNVLATTYAVTPVAPGTIAAAPTGLTTTQVLAAVGATSPGFADVWVGTLTLPYYLTAAANAHDPTVVTAHWTAAGPPPAGLDPTSRVLTRFNPIPARTSYQTVPMVVGVPDAAHTGCTEPAAGWPVVVFMHGITGNRTNAFAIMDAYASRCFAVVAIDQPLHGITDPTNPFFHNQLFTGTPAAALITGERTFDLDLMNNATGAPGPDGVIDPSAGVGGSTFVDLPNPLTGRDNLRQAESDLLWLAHALPTLSLGVNKNGSSDVDGTQLQLAGQSLGSIVGTAAMGVRSVVDGSAISPYRSGMLSVDGGYWAYLGVFSPTFEPVIAAGLAAESGGVIVPGASMYDNFFRDVQTIADAADPANFIKSAVAARPLLLQQVVGGGPLPDGSTALPDQVVDNPNTARLLAGAPFARFTVGAAPQPLAAGTGAYVNFIYGRHQSLLDPSGTTVTGPTNLAAWAEMQSEAVGFALARGQAVTVGAGAPVVVQP
ncbi:MAG: hypothetical protein JSR54_05040 [Proteobacteria bacterium]|nr:hypothetical protein [Pseudomonadota bacterium]